MGTTTVKTTTAFNTYNWPSHTWGSSDQGVNSWPSTTQSPALNKNFNKNKKIISWQKNSWTTTERTTTPSPGEYWATSAPKRELTSKSVLASPSDPTKPLGETATFSSNPWPSQFSSDLLGNVGHTQQTQKTRSQDTVPAPIKKRDEILKKNYFFTPSPTPLHLRNGINKIPNFESEFTAFGSEAHKSTFSSFDTNFAAPQFGGGARLKKEVKSSDVMLGGEKTADTYYHYGHPDSSADASVDPTASVVREEQQADLVQLYLPDPLAPGHPMGNGNHGWAPIEEWAEAQLRENLDSPSWADTPIPPANSITGSDWSDKTKPSPGRTIKKVKTLKKWSSPSSPSPAPFQPGSPSPPSFRMSSTVRPDTVTVSQADVSTMRYPGPSPGPSPVTPLYSTNFGDYASLSVEHVGGPTGAPGLALFNTVGPHQPHSNSHYMEQNPFIVSPVTPISVTAATAAAIRRNMEPAEYWSYNPVTEANSVKTYSPLPRSRSQLSYHLCLISLLSRNAIWDPAPASTPQGQEDSPVTGFSYKNVDWPKTGVSAGYENFHY